MTQPLSLKPKAHANHLKKANARWFTLVFSVGLAACTSQPDCTSLPEDSATANAGCLVIQDDRVLMIHQRKNDTWSMPGGTAERNERSVCVAARETEEETGIQVEVMSLAYVFDNGFRLYYCDAKGEQPIDVQDQLEVKQAAWLTASEREKRDWRFNNQKKIIRDLVEAKQKTH